MATAATAETPQLDPVDGHPVRRGRTCDWIYAPVEVLSAGNVRTVESHWVPLLDYLESKGKAAP